MLQKGVKHTLYNNTILFRACFKKDNLNRLNAVISFRGRKDNEKCEFLKICKCQIDYLYF